ncbi:hypothetical protein L9F63_010391, partial [Diploptera punctata]
MNPYIRTVFYVSKVLNLIPTKITKNRNIYKFNKISVPKLIINTFFHSFCNIMYFLNCFLFVSANMKENVKKYGAYFLAVASSICHIAVISVCTIYGNKIFDLVFCSQSFVYFQLARKKESYKEIIFITAIAFLLLFLNSVNSIYLFVISNYLFMITYCTWYVMIISINVTCLHFTTIMQHLKIIIEKINYLFSKMQIKPTAVSSVRTTKCNFMKHKTEIHKIKLLMKYYCILCNSTVEINRIYSPIMLIIAAKMFVVATYFTLIIQNYIFLKDETDIYTIFNFLTWSGLEIVTFYTVLYACSSFVKEVRQ